MQGDLYIYGEITSYQGKDAKTYGAVNPRDVQDQLQANSDAEEIIVHINSNGGDVDAGFAIYDILKNSGKKITTLIEGQCYSIATVIFLAGSKRMATENSEFLIHLPMGGDWGNAEDLERTAEVLRKFENKAAEFYASHTTMSADEAIEEMKKDTFMELDTAKEYGFITEIIETVKAVAKVSFKKSKMSKEEKAKNNFWKKFMAILDDSTEGTPEVKNLTLKNAKGENVEFKDREEGSIEIGDKALINGEDPDGEILMANGDTLTFEKGELKNIQEKEVVDDPDIAAMVNNAVTEAMKPLMEKIEAKDEVITNLETKLDKHQKTFDNLKSLASDNVIEGKENKKKTSDKKKNEKVHALSLSKIENK